MENGAADAAVGHSSPVPSEAPAAAAAAPPIKARRESLCRARCDDSEPGATGRPLLSMPNASMVTAPKAEPDPAETLTPHHLPVQSPAQRSSVSRNGRAAGQGRRRVPRCAGGRIGEHVPRPPPPSLAPGPGTSRTVAVAGLLATSVLGAAPR